MAEDRRDTANAWCKTNVNATNAREMQHHHQKRLVRVESRKLLVRDRVVRGGCRPTRAMNRKHGAWIIKFCGIDRSIDRINKRKKDNHCETSDSIHTRRGEQYDRGGCRPSPFHSFVSQDQVSLYMLEQSMSFTGPVKPYSDERWYDDCFLVTEHKSFCETNRIESSRVGPRLQRTEAICMHVDLAYYHISSSRYSPLN
mmetsp:Transcript_28981/g.68082  ORF Transcript_28981/g.68082 Transcript_28981/m.68082 type:complete len:199 (-) Transcript_28981:133-729(-)